MTFQALQNSRYDATPITLYEFQYGTNVFWRYCNHDEDVTRPVGVVQGAPATVTYKSIAITHSKIEQTGRLEDAGITIELERDTELAEFYKASNPSQIVSLRMFQTHVDDQDTVAVWVGRVTGVQLTEASCKVSCESLATAILRPGLKRNYQYGCSWVLYGYGCWLNQDDFVNDVVITGVGGNSVKLPNNWRRQGLDSIHYHAGKCTWEKDGERFVRWIQTVVTQGNDEWLVFNQKNRKLAIGDTIKVYPGCRHTLDDCEHVFGNQANFGGQPYIPAENPVSQLTGLA